VGLHFAHVLGKTLALVIVHHWNSGHNAPQSGGNVVHVIHQAYKFAGSDHAFSLLFARSPGKQVFSTPEEN
jgi:hypothetical protein